MIVALGPRAAEGQWTRWFAWRPVWLDGETVIWLHWVERRWTWGYEMREWEYRV